MMSKDDVFTKMIIFKLLEIRLTEEYHVPNIIISGETD